MLHASLVRLRHRPVLHADAGARFRGPAAPDISGTYWTTSYGPKMQVLGGGEPPLNAAGGAAYEMNQAGLKDGSIVDKARRVCVPDGVPRVGAQDPDDEASMNNDPIEISK
jgi:hypothetical protein